MFKKWQKIKHYCTSKAKSFASFWNKYDQVRSSIRLSRSINSLERFNFVVDDFIFWSISQCWRDCLFSRDMNNRRPSVIITHTYIPIDCCVIHHNKVRSRRTLDVSSWRGIPTGNERETRWNYGVDTRIFRFPSGPNQTSCVTRRRWKPFSRAAENRRARAVSGRG